jgi:hypothetical protein
MVGRSFRRLEKNPETEICPLPDSRTNLSCNMRRNPDEKGRFSDRGEGLGTVTKKMVMVRARQIAVINGRTEKYVMDSDIAEARRELQGEDEMDPTPTRGENLPEDKRWDPVPGSEGRSAPTVPASDEQNFAEKLYDEGVADAEHDQEIEATREDIRREKRS